MNTINPSDKEVKQIKTFDVEFIVGQNDLDFYQFMNENHALPDIITCCRFSLHDAAPLKGSLMDLSTTEEAGAIYDTYLKNFTNEDGTVNWLPVCGDSQGFVINKELFEENNIPVPTDYDSFVYAVQAFEELGMAMKQLGVSVCWMTRRFLPFQSLP